MAVFTCFNHGTKANRAGGARSGELVHVLSQLVQGNEAVFNNGVLTSGTYLINEGPGATSGGLAHPSLMNPFTGTEKGRENAGSDFSRGFHGETSKHWAVTGLLFGGGWTDNVSRALFIIQSLKFGEGIDIDTVNMTGWSRGGVTCIRIANALWEVFRDTVRCNIFCIDPVAGWDVGEEDDKRDLPPNVDNFFAVLSMHERRTIFNPQDLSRVRKMQVHGYNNNVRIMFLPMGGTHDQQVKRKDAITESHDISISMVYAFLRHFGTPFNGVPPHYISTARDMCEYYARMRIKLDGGVYTDRQTKGIGARAVGAFRPFLRRDFAKTANMDQYVSSGKHGYWVNEHHRACFMNAFPLLYHHVFATQPGLSQGWTVITEPLMLGSPFCQSLADRGFIYQNTNIGRWIANVGSGYSASAGRLHAQWPGDVPLV